MNIAVDFGNTIAKVGIFEDDLLRAREFFQDAAGLKSFLERSDAENIIVSSVSVAPTEILTWSTSHGKKIILTAEIPLPVTILYKTPKTLGVDRIAGVCGALSRFPGQHCLVIDAGTCINYEFLDDQRNYHGGAISPGVKMRFEAMHKFTARLPLANPVDDAMLTGNSTETCLQSGAINGVKAEVRGMMAEYRKAWPDLRVLLCGGDAHYFEDHSDRFISLEPDLVLTGLNAILQHSVSLR